jgi:hypothetical protein
MEEAWMH